MLAENTAVVVIDLQKEYFVEDRPWYVPNGERVLENCQRLLDIARETDATVVHARHVQPSRDAPVFAWGSEYTEIIDEIDIRDDDHLVTKTKPSCFQDTRLADILVRNGIENVVSIGLLSAICVDTTAREADARGYDSHYVTDATSTFPIGDNDPAKITDTIAAVHDTIFSNVTTTDEIVDRLE
ncbi:cysteine hydrolase family protein [Natronorubrum bangense]|nr:isochorismatase family protein [Natronorubrum bangense]ELY51068.1 putative isochorismatase family protein [Natronorubrum bangense JCM 10635]